MLNPKKKQVIIELCTGLKDDIKKCHWLLSNNEQETGFLKQAAKRVNKIIEELNYFEEE